MFNKLKQFKELRDQAKEVQNKLSQLVISSEQWNGNVKIEMDGTHKITSLTINPEILHPEQQKHLEQAIQDCFQDCVKKVQKSMMDQMRGGDLKLPDISGLQ